MESQTDNEFCKENNVRRYVSFVHFYSRFPLFDRNKVEDETSFSLHYFLVSTAILPSSSTALSGVRINYPAVAPCSLVPL